MIKGNNSFAVGALAMLLGAGPLAGAPVISSFSPSYGAYGDPGFITINGSGFSPGTLVVKFNGVAAPASAPAANQIQAQVPAGAPLGPGPIYVKVGSDETYSADDFTVIGPGPYVTGFSPSIGSGGTPVTINGAHFSNPLTVKFTGVNPFNVNPASPTSFTVNAPAGVMSGPITLSTVLGSYTTPTNFHVPPAITGFSPSKGRAGTNVLITGSSFLEATAVRFGTLDATTFSVLSNGAIQATVPVNAVNGQIRVIAPAGSAFSGSNFVVLATITGFSPGFGPVGTSVTINGANFTDGLQSVTFNGVAATVTSTNFNQLTALVPAGASSGPIAVTTTNGAVTNATLFYLPPRITSFTPNNSGPGTTVKITGENFTNASAVDFSGAAAASFVVSNNTTIGAIVPFGVVSGPISITTPAGTTNSSSRFYAPPVISVFNPTHGLPGTNVTLTGQNFFDATAVRFNGSNATFSVVNNTTINATVPNNAQTGPITVVAPAGTNTTAVDFVLDYTANLSVTVTDSPDPVTVTSNLTYSIVVANSGPYPIPNVMLTNLLPGTVVLKSATTSAGTLNTNSNPIIGALGQINVGGNATVTLVVAPQFAGTISNFAAVAGLHPDPTPANNTAGNDTLVLPLALLSIRPVSPVAVRVSWPAALTNYALEFKPVLTTNYNWSNVSTPPSVSGNENFVNDVNSGAMKYYRLRK